MEHSWWTIINFSGGWVLCVVTGIRLDSVVSGVCGTTWLPPLYICLQVLHNDVNNSKQLTIPPRTK